MNNKDGTRKAFVAQNVTQFRVSAERFCCLLCAFSDTHAYLTNSYTAVCINTIVKSKQYAIFRNFFKGRKPELRCDKFLGAGVSE